MLARQTLRLLVDNQPLQLLTGIFQQQGEAFVQSTLAIFRWRNAVESHQRMQAQTRQGFAPVRFAVFGTADKIQHRQQRFAATGQHRQFITVFGQHRFACVDHIQAGIRGQQLAQHLGFLLEALASFAAVEKTRQACRSIQTLAGTVQAL